MLELPLLHAERPSLSQRPQQMSYDGGLLALMEREDGILVEPVGMRDPCVLTLMLDPAFDDESLGYLSWFGNVFPDVPANGSIALSLRAKRAERSYKLGKPVDRNPILDLYQDRATVICRPNGDDGLGPMIRRREIRGGVLGQAPTTRQGQAHDLSDGGDNQSGGNIGPGR